MGFIRRLGTMRLKAEDPLGQVSEVYFNGVREFYCVEADEENGWVDVMVPKHDKPGEVGLDEEGRPVIMRKHGKVKIKSKSDQCIA
jgi:uncharacterized protein (DUF39 family)